MEEIVAVARELLGEGRDADIDAAQMALRAAIVYVVTLAIVRLGKKRFMGRGTAFDVILGIMLGSIASRAITGNAPFLPALAAAASLIATHWLFTLVALHWRGFEHFIKGRSRLLIRQGIFQDRQMRRAHVTAHDLSEDLRRAGVTGPEQVAEAHLERSGSISVMKAKGEPKVVEVSVAPGVQTVRIQLS